MGKNQTDVLDKLPLRVQTGSNLSQSSESKFAARLRSNKHITQLQQHTKHMSSKVGKTIPPTEFQLNFDGKKQHAVHRGSKVFVEGKKHMGGTCLIPKSALGINHSKINKATEVKAKLSVSQDYSEGHKSINPSNFLLNIPVSQTKAGEDNSLNSIIPKEANNSTAGTVKAKLN